MVFILLMLIIGSIFTISQSKDRLNMSDISGNFALLLPFLPIIFTSFGVQNVCPFVAQHMGIENIKAIKKAFLIGTLIPAIVYALWIYAVLKRIYVFDNELYVKLLHGTIDVGELVKSLCNSAHFEFESVILKLLSLFAILTSATGTGIGLISSLKETTLQQNKLLISLIVIGIPAFLTLVIPNAFIRILSFGGMIATTFVIFMPVYLNSKISKISLADVACLIFGVLVVIAEIFM